MIVTDLDGTLLKRDKTISEYTASIFRRCREKGIKIVIATARPIRSVKMLDLNINADAAVYHNGAITTIDDVLFQQTGIKPETVRNVICSVLQIADTQIAVEINDTQYANFDPSKIWPDCEAVLSDFTDLPNLPADKIILQKTDNIPLSAMTRLFDDDLYWEISENEIYMIMNRNARKQNAVSALSAHFGIKLSEIAAFGNDYNDIEMLCACGIGATVSNAIEEAKAAADYICMSNDEDGVARWIEEHIL